MTSVNWEGVPVDVVTSEWHTLVVPTVRAVLVDQAANPVVGCVCEITGPNGFKARVVTDANGRVSVPAPAGEKYEITYVDLDQDVWATAPEEAQASTAQ